MAKRKPRPPKRKRGPNPDGPAAPPGSPLNRRAARLADQAVRRAIELRIDVLETADGAAVLDFGIRPPGGLAAGVVLAGLCTADLATIEVSPGTLGDRPWPRVSIRTDAPLDACLRSQYAGRKVTADGFFAMGSGPLRAATGDEELIRELGEREGARRAVGVLETRTLPPPPAVAGLAAAAAVPQDRLTLAVAPTGSLAGCVQIAARSVETALHKLHALGEQACGFPLSAVLSGVGNCPLAPAGRDDAAALGRTNDAILYGSAVTLWIDAPAEALKELAPKLPSSASEQHGRPFAELLSEAGGDFYQLDSLLFAPAAVTLISARDGGVASAGTVRADLLERSFGLG